LSLASAEPLLRHDAIKPAGGNPHDVAPLYVREDIIRYMDQRTSALILPPRAVETNSASLTRLAKRRPFAPYFHALYAGANIHKGMSQPSE
jgi:hypothetical protein